MATGPGTMFAPLPFFPSPFGPLSRDGCNVNAPLRQRRITTIEPWLEEAIASIRDTFVLLRLECKFKFSTLFVACRSFDSSSALARNSTYIVLFVFEPKGLSLSASNYSNKWQFCVPLSLSLSFSFGIARMERNIRETRVWTREGF